MERIFVVDDDPISLKILRAVFLKTNYEVSFFNNGADALHAYQPGAVDLIISDFFMPGVDGSDLLRQVRRVDPDVGFVYLTSNQDLAMAVEMVKAGADDHIVKPIQPDELIARVQKNIDDTRRRQLLRKYESEMRDENLESHSMINWRLMYATKETHQIEQAISLMNRTMNQAGGFIWADIMRSMLPAEPSETITLPRDIVEIALDAASRYKELFDLLKLIGELNTMNLQMEVMEAQNVLDQIQSYLDTKIFPLFAQYERPIRLISQAELLPVTYQVDMSSIRQIILELAVNALKYSPPKTDIILGWQQCSLQNDTPLIFSMANQPTDTQALHDNTYRIRGIPREYSEQVFELFYTIDAFPVHLPEEQWRNGTGLHIARKLMHLMGGWIQNHNIIDHTGKEAAPYIEFNLRFPQYQPDKKK